MTASFISAGVELGRPVTHGSLSLRPASRSIAIRLPMGGFVWNRPVAVQVLAPGGQAQTLAIRDVTCWAMAAAVASAALAGLISLALIKSRRTGGLRAARRNPDYLEVKNERRTTVARGGHGREDRQHAPGC